MEDQPIVGQTVHITAGFVNNAGVYSTPTSLKVLLRSPSGVVSDVTASASQPTTGRYLYKWTPTLAGVWVVHWEGILDTDEKHMREQIFQVLPRAVPDP